MADYLSNSVKANKYICEGDLLVNGKKKKISRSLGRKLSCNCVLGCFSKGELSATKQREKKKRWTRKIQLNKRERDRNKTSF